MNTTYFNDKIEKASSEYCSIMNELRETLPDAGRELRLEFLRDAKVEDESYSPLDSLKAGAMVLAAPFVIAGAMFGAKDRQERNAAALDHAVTRLRALRESLLGSENASVRGAARDVERACLYCLRLRKQRA